MQFFRGQQLWEGDRSGVSRGSQPVTTQCESPRGRSWWRSGESSQAQKLGRGDCMEAKILVVDDEPANCALFEAILRNQGYSVVLATDGHGALEEFARHRPDLILLDVMIPRPDGFEVCRRLKANPDTRLIPVVLVTALS